MDDSRGMTIAADFALIALNEEGKPRLSGNFLAIALAGGLVVDLAAAGRLTLTNDRVQVENQAPLSDSLLTRALTVIAADKSRKPKKVVNQLARGMDVRRLTYTRLAGSEHVRHEEKKVIGLFPVDRWPPVSARRDEAFLLARQVLTRERKPNVHTGGLVSLLHGFRIEHWIVPELGRRELRRRAKEIAESDWASAAASQAVRVAIQAAQAAAMVATSGAIAASSASGSG